MSNATTPEDLSALYEAYRALVFRLPEGTQVTAYREQGARSGVVTVTYPNGERTTYVADGK